MGELLLTSIDLKDFRNHERWSLGVETGTTILVGPNAAGKTNILEAVAVATTGRSFRPFSWEDVVREGQKAARVTLEGRREGVPFAITFLVNKEGGREHLLDGTAVSSDVLSQRVPVVSFVPENLSLSKGAAEERRAAIDRIGGCLSPAYAKVRREYVRIVKQRNHALRSGLPAEQGELWGQALSEVGAALSIQRARLLSRMEPELAAAYETMGEGESFRMHISASWSPDPLSPQDVVELGRDGITNALGKALEDVEEEERRRRFSLAGPHRDDLVFLLEGREARAFASQGQHRTLALAWKAAEVSVVRHVTGYQPILLLDDVMSELDEVRRTALSHNVIDEAQAIVTTTNIDYFAEEKLATSAVVRI